MSVIVYKCDTCNRTIDLPQNKEGLEVIQRCIITDQCRGKLYIEAVKQDNIRGQFPSSVLGLDDWIQRKVLYNHTQTIAQTVWQIKHNLGVFPSIQVYVDRPISTTTTSTETIPCSSRVSSDELTELVEVDPSDITFDIINENEVDIIFPTTESGIAQCIARSSAPSVIETPVTETASFQLTSSSELTIATNADVYSGSINVTLTFITPDDNEVDIIYTVSDTPSLIYSPWSDTNELFIRNKTYTTRSFNFISGQTEFTDGTIPEGSYFYIKEIDSAAINPEDVLVLLANSPYETYDKIVDQLIDPTQIGSADAPTSFYYNDVQLFAYETLLEGVYPYIQEI